MWSGSDAAGIRARSIGVVFDENTSETSTTPDASIVVTTIRGSLPPVNPTPTPRVSVTLSTTAHVPLLQLTRYVPLAASSTAVVPPCTVASWPSAGAPLDCSEVTQPALSRRGPLPAGRLNVVA